MQHLISWKQYWMTSSLFLVIYYAFIVLMFYRSELLQIKLARRFMGRNADADEFPVHNLNGNLQDNQIIQNPLKERVDAFSVELDALLIQSAAQKKAQSDIVESLKKLTTKYPTLKDSSFQEVLISRTKIETEKICKIHLTEEELTSVWSRMTVV